MPETITKTYELISVKGVKGWIRDSWARRAIVALQQAIAGIVVPTASTANPQMDGTAAPGSSTDYARADHVHPQDTSKQDTLTAAQLAAVDSGVTAAKVQTWDGITVPTKTSDLTNDSGFITSGKFAVVDGTLPSAGGFGTEVAYPTGFTATNSVILSVSAYIYSEWRQGVGIAAASERLWCDLTATGVKPFISSTASFYNAPFRAVLMRTDI